MQNKIDSRLTELQSEYQKGQERLAALEQETANTRASMLRISGAIQVLEELLQDQDQDRQPEPGEQKPENGQAVEEKPVITAGS